VIIGRGVEKLPHAREPVDFCIAVDRRVTRRRKRRCASSDGARRSTPSATRCILSITLLALALMLSPSGAARAANDNPAPDFYGEIRPGANLYTDSLVALDAKSGKLLWYKQFIPHDVHDADLSQVSPLFETTIDGKKREVISISGKDGLLRPGEVLHPNRGADHPRQSGRLPCAGSLNSHAAP
jgi:hypothetical protein